MAKTRTFTPPMPVYMRRSAEITNFRTMPASGRTAGKTTNTLRTAPQGATQLPNRPSQPLRPSRAVDAETEARELAEARILLCQRKILAQVGGVAENQIHRLIDNGIS